MPSFWVDVCSIGAVLAIIACQVWFFRGRKAPWNSLHERVDGLLEALQKESSKEPDPDAATWRAALERRMEILEADVIRHLQKINQRAAVAERAERRRAGDLDAEEDEPEVDRAELEQLKLALGGGANGPAAVPEDLSLDEVRAAMRGR